MGPTSLGAGTDRHNPTNIWTPTLLDYIAACLEDAVGTFHSTTLDKCHTALHCTVAVSHYDRIPVSLGDSAQFHIVIVTVTVTVYQNHTVRMSQCHSAPVQCHTVPV